MARKEAGSISRHLFAVIILVVAGLQLGCQRTGSPSSTPAASASSGTGASVEQSSAGAEEPTWSLPFAEATRPDVPLDGERPPDLTLTGKSVGKLYSEVRRTWDDIRFVTADGQRIQYRAVLETELGAIEIELRPQIAPSHVRNFIALARAGYYDGLVFERAIRARQDDNPDVVVEVLEGGCPVGTGEMGLGSLGYWLKPELSKEPHEVGTVGMCHGLEVDTACCRFYITLTKATLLDEQFSIFGRVTQGLDVARRIFSLPARKDPEYPEGDRPEKPVVIRKVTIHAQTAGPESLQTTK